MTYCLAIRVDTGIVFAADTRTNAGADYVTSYRKLHVLGDFEDRQLVLLTAGNLGVTQEICQWLRRDLESTDGRESLVTHKHLFEVADYVGRTSRAIQDRHNAAFAASGINGAASLILGGQIEGAPHEIFLIYPEGNFIEASADTPYLQIGENKYGKPMLDRLVCADLSIPDAARLALVSLDATVRSNVTVGLPIDLAIYERDTLKITHEERLEQTSDYLVRLRQSWHRSLCDAFANLPAFEWEQGP